jgi:sugar phosphate isomerase/epimerase
VTTWRIGCQEQLLPGDTLLDKWEFAQQAGFDGIELRGRGDFAFAKRLPELRQARDRGVPMPTECVEMQHFIGAFEDEQRADAIRQMASQLSVMAEIGGEVAMTPAAYGMFSRRLPPYEPPRSAEDDRQVLLDALGQLGEHAHSEGVVICLEPLNRYEDHLVNTLEGAVSLCRELALPSVRVAGDTYHMNIEETDPAAALLTAGDWLGHVQLSDSNRMEPGAGHIDWGVHLAALEAARYGGWLAFECRLTGPAETVLPAAVSVIRRAGR